MHACRKQSRLIRNFLIALLSVLYLSACAHQPATSQGAQLAASEGPGAIQEIKVTGTDESPTIELLIDKPVTFTSYKAGDKAGSPARLIVDLADVVPGKASSWLQVNKGNISNITVQKHDLSGGIITRVVVGLAQDVEAQVNKDQENSGKLLIAFAPTTLAPAATSVDATKQAEAATTSAVTAKPLAEQVEPVAAKPDPAQQKDLHASQATIPESASQVKTTSDFVPIRSLDESRTLPVSAKPNAVNETAVVSAPSVSPEEPVKAVEESPKAEAAAETIKPAAQQPVPAERQLKAIQVGKDAIDIVIAGGLPEYKAFKLSKPDRLVLDLMGVKNGMAERELPINALGIASARVGGHPDKVRIVFDAAQAVLPRYEVSTSPTGLKLAFTAVEAVSAKEAPIQKPVVPEPPVQKPVVEAKAQKPKVPAVESIDFTVKGGVARLAVKTSPECTFDQPVKSRGDIILVVKNCLLPKQLQRTIDTRSFGTAVRKVTPYQVRTKTGRDAKIVVNLSSDAEFALKREGDVVALEVKGAEAPDAQALVSEAVKTPVEAQQAQAKPAVTEQGKPEKSADIAEQKPVASQKRYTGRKVTLEFTDADVKSVLHLIEEVSGQNFLFGDDVSGKITLKLVNVPWDQALEIILDSKGLERRQEGNVVYIKPKGKFTDEKVENEKRMPMVTQVFDLNFATLADIEKQFKELGSKLPGTSVISDARTNKIIAVDNEIRLKSMKDLLTQLDVPEKQVMIEARIVQATSTFTRDLGIAWGVHYNPTAPAPYTLNAGFGGRLTNIAPTADVGVDGGAITFGKLIGNVQIDMRLSAAASAELLKVISTPKVLTLNNKAAKIAQGQSIPYLSVSAEGTKTEFVEAVLSLEVTPHITADGSIIMKIKATNNTAGTGSPPPINKKEATTELLVRNGETTVIGGIYVDDSADTDHGVPFLMDIPLIGGLFKSNFKKNQKTELLIFITPKIVS